jgi:hypothetical protein
MVREIGPDHLPDGVVIVDEKDARRLTARGVVRSEAFRTRFTPKPVTA